MLIGNSEHTKALKARLEELSGAKKDFVLWGEAGVGKTTITDQIANLDASGVVIEASRIAENELDQKLQAVSSGTVVIEDLCKSSFRVQAVLNSFLQKKSDDVRVIITLSKSVEDLSAKRKITEELSNVLSAMELVHIQPLRSRPEDIPHLLRHFAPDLAIDINSLELLTRREWSGNIRELKAIIDRTEIAEDGSLLLPQSIVDEKVEIVKAVNDLATNSEQGLDESLNVLEQSILLRALNKFGLNPAKAAQFLGMSENAFNDKTKNLAVATAKNS